MRGPDVIVCALALLQRSDVGADDLAAATGVRRLTALRWLHGMVRVGMAHIGSWQPPASGRGPWDPMFAAGVGVSAQPPCGHHRVRAAGMSTLTAVAQVWAALVDACTSADLVECSGLTVATVRRLLTAMRARRLVRVSGWLPRPDGLSGVAAPLYRIGSGADAPRPARRSAVEHGRAYRQRRRARAAAGATLAAVWGPTP